LNLYSRGRVVVFAKNSHLEKKVMDAFYKESTLRIWIAKKNWKPTSVCSNSLDFLRGFLGLALIKAFQPCNPIFEEVENHGSAVYISR